MTVQIQMRRDTAANWTSDNPTPAQGEWCLETDTDNFKIGDGVTAWNALADEVKPFSVMFGLIQAASVGAIAASESFASQITNAASVTLAASIAAIPSGVTSVFGRTGHVVASVGDYVVGQITGAAPLASPALTGAPTVNGSPFSIAAFTTVAASGDTTGAADATNLNAVLSAARIAGSGTIKGVAGSTYYINVPLIVGSNCRLDMTGCTVNLAAGSSCQMIKNYATTPVATSADGSISSGSNILATSLGASASAGQSVTVANAGGGGVSPLVGLISGASTSAIAFTNPDGSSLVSQLINISQALSTSGAITSLPVSALTQVVSSGSVTVTSGLFSKTFATTGASVGSTHIAVSSATPNFNYPMNSYLSASCSIRGASVALYARDVNVEVIGGYWNKGNNSGVGALLCHGLSFHHVDNCYVDPEDVTSTGSDNGHAIDIADCTNVYTRLRAVNFQGVAIQGTGPIYGWNIPEVTGTTDDDGVALVCGDFPNHSECSGNIIGVTVGTINVQSTVANLFKIIAGVGNFVDNIKVTGMILGSTAGQNTVYLGDALGNAQTIGGAYGSIDLGYVAGAPNAANYIVGLFSPSATHIKANINWNGIVATGGAVGVGGGSTVAIDHLEISGDFNSSQISNGSAPHVVAMLSSSVTITRLTLDKVKHVNNATVGGCILYFGTAATITQANLIGCRSTGGSGGFAYMVNINFATATLTQINFIGGSSSQSGGLVINSIQTTNSTVVFSGGFEAGAQGRVCQYSGASGTITFCLYGAKFDTIANQAFRTIGPNFIFQGDGLATSGTFSMLTNSASGSVQCLGQGLPFDVATLTGTSGDKATNTNAASAPLGPCTYNGSRWIINAGVNTSTNPSLTSGTASQINTLQAVDLYLDVVTGGTLTFAMGAASTASTVIYSGASVSTNQAFPMIEVPAAWWVKPTLGSGASVTATAITI